MENGLGVVDVNHMIKAEVMVDESVERINKSIIDGFLDSNDLEGEDVFEEAHDNLQLKVNADDFSIESDQLPYKAYESSNLELEDETFQEAIEDSEEPEIIFQVKLNDEQGTEVKFGQTELNHTVEPLEVNEGSNLGCRVEFQEAIGVSGEIAISKEDLSVTYQDVNIEQSTEEEFGTVELYHLLEPLEVDGSSNLERDVKTFEEAIGNPEKVVIFEQELPVAFQKVNNENDTGKEFEMDKLIHLDEPLEADENSNLGRDAETFQETIGDSEQEPPLTFQQVISQNVIGKEFGMDKSNHLMEPSEADENSNSGHDEVDFLQAVGFTRHLLIVERELPIIFKHVNNAPAHHVENLEEIDNAGGDEVSKNGDEVDNKSPKIIERFENGNFDHLNYEGAILDKSENSDEVRKVTDIVSLKTNEDVLQLNTQNRDNKSNKILNTSNGQCDIVDVGEEVKDVSSITDMGCEVKDTSDKLAKQYQDNTGLELKDIPAVISSKHHGDSDTVTTEIQSLTSAEHFDVKMDERFQVDTSDLGFEDPRGFQVQHATENGFKILDNNDTVEQPKYNQASNEEKTQYNERDIQVDCSSELKYISAEHHSDTSMVPSEIESSISIKYLDIQSEVLLQGHHMHSDVKKHEMFLVGTSDSGVQETKDSQAQQATEKVVEILNGHADAKDSKSNSEVFKEKKQTDDGNNEREIQVDSTLELKYGSDTDSSVDHKGRDIAALEIESSTLAEYSNTNPEELFHVETSDLGAYDIKVSHPQHSIENSVKIPEEPKSISAVQEDKNRTDEGMSRQVIQTVSKSASPTKLTKSAIIRPAGLGHATPLLERSVQPSRVNGSITQTQSQLTEDPTNGEPEEIDGTCEKLQMLRVKFLRLAHRLGQTPHNVVVAQVLYRLGLAEQLHGRNGGRVGSFDSASAKAEQLEAAGQEPLDFSCTIMVLGKAGVGKSATINSIFDKVKFSTDAFDSGTKKVQEVVGTVQGIKVRVVDTPGLLPFWSDQRHNEKILRSVKHFIKKSPDIVLYLDRLDMHTREFGDMSLLRTITSVFGASVWFNAIVVLTHAASAPPDGPNGIPTTYEMFVTQRSHTVQQAVRMAAGDMRLLNPVSLVENHSACRTNRAGQRVLPNGLVWKPHLLLLSFASKILAEANKLLNLQDNPPGKPFTTTRSRTLPLPYLLSSLTQSRPQLKLPEEQFDNENALDDDLDESSDSDDDMEFDELPPFRRLTKAQLKELSKNQRKAYFNELEYREKLFMKRQLKEDRKQRKMINKMAASTKNSGENIEEDGGAASVPVPVPDLSLPASFDSDNPIHRYRFLDNSNQWIVRPVLETHGWDHDVGYEGINVEKLFVVKDNLPLSLSGQVSKDKNDANLQMEIASSIKHGRGKVTSLGFDLQTAGKDIIYTIRGDTKFCNLKRNKAMAGLSVTLLGNSFSTGIKLEDKLIVNKRLQVVVIGGAMTSRGDVAYGGNMEATLRDKDFPLGRSLSTVGVSIVDWHGDLSVGCNIQSQIPVGRSTNLIGRASLNNKGTGQVSVRLNSSEQWQIVLLGVLPLARKLMEYYQQFKYGEC